MLKAVGLEMPKTVLAHGWWTLAGAKVSKSRGNVVDPAELVKKYGVDAFRYFLLNEVTIGNDGAFSEDLLAERYTTDLANDLGNLWFRLAAMLEKYFNGATPQWNWKNLAWHEVEDLFAGFQKAMEEYDPRSALRLIFSTVTRANQYIDEKKPWVLAKDHDSKDKLAEVLGTLTEWVAHIGVLLLPLLPNTAKEILRRFQLPTEWAVASKEEFARSFLKPGMAVERGDALFPKLDEEKIAK
jgi:methionyl-tRNA synthetase